MRTTLGIVLLALGAVLAGPLPGHAQTSDPVLDLLVQKGVITQQEADKARKEVDKGFTRAFAAKTGMPEWVKNYKLSGDFRGRFEGFYADNPAAADRNRLQYRLRLGMAVNMVNDLQVGLRLASIGDTPGNPISSNQTLDNNASKKGLAIGQVYARWLAVNTEDWNVGLTFGKMENPLQFTPAVIDPDYTPEGFGQQIVYRVNPRHELKLNLGEFMLEERAASSLDTYMLGAQALWDAKWSDEWQTTLGIGTLILSGKDSLTVANGQLNIGEGNSRVGGLAANAPLYNFNPIIGDAAVTYTMKDFPGYPGAFPIRLAGEYFKNPAAPTHNDGLSAKLTLGKAGKRRTWEAGYEFRYVRADAIYEELPESDFNAFTQTARTVGGTAGFVNGTNVRGHIVKLGYAPFDALTFFVTCWMTENMAESPVGSNSRASRLQVDAVWKF